MKARVAQSVEHRSTNLEVVGEFHCERYFFILYFVAFDVLLAGRLVPYKWNQAWHLSEVIDA